MEISRKELLEAADLVRPALASRSAIVGLTHLWFDGDYVYAHDGGLGAKVEFKFPLKLGVPGALLIGLLNQLSSDKVTVDADEGALVFKVGRSRTKLATLPYDHRVWPYPESPTSAPTLSLGVTDALQAGLRKVFAVKAANPTRMEHHAVLLNPVGGETDVYTTDSQSIASVSLPGKLRLDEGVQYVALPRVLMEQLTGRRFKDATVEQYRESVSARVVSYFRVASPGDVSPRLTFYSNVFDATDVVDVAGTLNRLFDPDEYPLFTIPVGFGVLLERARLLAGSEEPHVKLVTDNRVLRVSGDFAVGSISEEFETDNVLPKVMAVVNATRLASMLKTLCVLSVSPKVICGAGAGAFVYMVAVVDHKPGR